jgi:hypothetical protein
MTISHRSNQNRFRRRSKTNKRTKDSRADIASTYPAALLAFGDGLDLIDALALDLFRGDMLGDRGHRVLNADKGVGEEGPAVLQPGLHISKYRGKIVSLDFPDHQVALRLCPGVLNIGKLEELGSDEAWDCAG